MSTINHTGTEGSSHRRESFSVQGVRVELDGQRGWRCTCTASEENPNCSHVEQAQLFRSMRGAQRDEDTIEVQFSAAQWGELSRPAHTTEFTKRLAVDVASPKRARRHTSWTVVTVAASMSAIASGITYIAATRAEGSRAVEPQSFVAALAPPAKSELAAPGQMPVKFVNPFDRTEVFEFPPETSEAAARDAVAELLLNRARYRLATGETMEVRGREVADRTTHMAGSG